RAPADLVPGDPWEGPHVGILYILVAGCDDIRYEIRSARRTREVLLSDDVGHQAARRLAQRLSEHKGRSGGRFYINEASELFAPINTAGGVSRRYLGHLDDDLWFPAPDVPGRSH